VGDFERLNSSAPNTAVACFRRVNLMSHRQRQRLHPDVLKLGMVSFLTDVSSEMIFAVFAVFFTTVAGASSALLGLIEGLADFSASSLNYLAGWMSDRSGRRKWFAIAGYAFSTSAKIILLASSSIAALSVFRVIERLGKGFRGPPRDAWLASLSDKESRALHLACTRRSTRQALSSDLSWLMGCCHGWGSRPARTPRCSGLPSCRPSSAFWCSHVFPTSPA
jgi:MFS family permease